MVRVADMIGPPGRPPSGGAAPSTTGPAAWVHFDIKIKKVGPVPGPAGEGPIEKAANRL